MRLELLGPGSCPGPAPQPRRPSPAVADDLHYPPPHPAAQARDQAVADVAAASYEAYGMAPPGSEAVAVAGGGVGGAGSRAAAIREAALQAVADASRQAAAAAGGGQARALPGLVTSSHDARDAIND